MYSFNPRFTSDPADLVLSQMKKRAQRVDTHTFTILLRGLAWHTDYPTALQRAISLYHSLYAENSPVKPTIIHTNAVLKVCARAKDLDALWGVAARLPKHGRCAPDNATFTTILNAVHRITRETAWEPGLGESDLSPQERADQIQRAVLQGRRMWAEIVERWRNGDIMLDEGLVCSMGRLLLLSDVPQDLDDILSLAEQTMGIRRQATCLPPKAILTNPAGKYLSVPPQQSSPTSEDESTDIVSASDQTAGPFASAGDDFVPGQEFDPITPKTFNIAGYVVPGPNTLSLLVDACTRLHSIRAAQDYWGLLTSEPYNISPDTDNYHTYLRLLRVQRASRLCVELVQEMRDGLGVGPPVEHSERRGVKGEEGGVRGKTFRIAMSACVRDSNNPNVLQHASKLCRMMTDCLPTPDMKAFSMFLDIALKTAAVNNDWRLLSTVLRGTELGIRGLRNHLHWDTWAKTKRANEYKEILEGDLRDFLRKLIGAYDYLINGSGHEMMHDELKKCKDQRSIISGWETKLGRIEGNLRGQKLLWEEGKERGHGRGMIEIRGNYGERRQLLGRKDTRNGREGETGRYLDKKMRGEEDEEDKGEGYDWKRESDSWGPAKANGADNSERASQSPKWGRPSTTEHRKYRPRDNSSGEGGQWKRINWSEVGEDKC